ncbi:protein ALP1-like [Lolium perenne]|uniref:protein ALP1-like n=1 Tax=Lolium perenne TaxID=4522 RepID=UPI003A99228A
MANLNYIYNCNDVESIQMLQMRRSPFYALVTTFKSRGLLVDSINTSVEEQVTMFLHIVDHNPRFRVIHSTFRQSTWTISRYFQQVLCIIGELRGEMIKPASTNTPPKIKNIYRWFPYFRNCIGAIDGTHVTAKVSISMSASFRGRNHYSSQNVLAAMDFDMRFTYVLAGWEGSANDASILADSLTRHDGLQIAEGWDEEDFFQEEFTLDEVEAGDNEAWKEKMEEWADAMWEVRGNTII